MNIYLVILFLIHIKIGYCFNVLTNSLIGYGTYSLIVDFWASIQVNNMKLLENIDTLNNEPLNNEFNLQKNKYMISSLSNMVEDLDYRNQWNIFMNETRNNNLLYDGNYTFLHRNYVNNATYQCSENEEDKEKTKLIINGTLQDISDGVDISLDKYKLIDIDWPNEKKEINLEILKDSFDGKSKFLVSPKEHLGQYLYNHQCVTNIDHYDCLKSCELDDECRGVEFNRLLIKQSENGYYLPFKRGKRKLCCPPPL